MKVLGELHHLEGGTLEALNLGGTRAALTLLGAR